MSIFKVNSTKSCRVLVSTEIIVPNNALLAKKLLCFNASKSG